MFRQFNQKGQIALLVTLVILGAILSIGVGLTLITIQEMRMASNIEKSAQAFYTANSGVEYALYEIYKRGSSPPTGTCDNIGEGQYCLDTSEGIESAGIVEGKRRTIRITFASIEIYTEDTDFDEGTLIGVEHETVPDELQLSRNNVILPFIWVPNSTDNTISKVNTETGEELGRYLVNPSSSSPSRTTVDLQGNCWVGNRSKGTAVKIGLYEVGQCIDRNENGIIETSQDVNSDGDIQGAEILDWGDDECVLYEVVLIPGFEGTFIPGEYTDGYSNSVIPRALAVDASNNIWVGTFTTKKYFYIDSSTGEILKTVDVSGLNHTPYGAVIDGNGILWSSGHSGNHVLRLDPSTNPPTISVLATGHFVYGLGIDYDDHLFCSSYQDKKLSRVNVLTATKDWTQNVATTNDRGVVCTVDNNVWVANYGNNTVTRYDNDGNLLATISGFNQPIGAAVDAAGKVWVCNYGNGYIYRIDPSDNTIDLSKNIINSKHYSYSDMTGIVARTITTKIGSWTIICDNGVANTPWGIISWTSDEPEGTSITVNVRSSNDQVNWSAWETAQNGIPLTATPTGRYLQSEVVFQIISGEVSPILYDLIAKAAIKWIEK